MAQIYEDTKVIAKAAADFGIEDEGKMVILTAIDGTGTATIGKPDGTTPYGVLLTIGDEGTNVAVALPNHSGIIELRCEAATEDDDNYNMTVDTDGNFVVADEGDTVFAAIYAPCEADGSLADGYLTSRFDIPTTES